MLLTWTLNAVCTGPISVVHLFGRLEAEEFQTECECLARNLECSTECGCSGSTKCLNRAVTERRTLVLGKDILEINSWGFDSYTRRNIFDGVFPVCFINV
jgi:hypothetical protein